MLAHVPFLARSVVGVFARAAVVVQVAVHGHRPSVDLQDEFTCPAEAEDADVVAVLLDDVERPVDEPREYAPDVLRPFSTADGLRILHQGPGVSVHIHIQTVNGRHPGDPEHVTIGEFRHVLVFSLGDPFYGRNEVITRLGQLPEGLEQPGAVILAPVAVKAVGRERTVVPSEESERPGERRALREVDGDAAELVLVRPEPNTAVRLRIEGVSDGQQVVLCHQAVRVARPRYGGYVTVVAPTLDVAEEAGDPRHGLGLAPCGPPASHIPGDVDGDAAELVGHE